MNAVDVEIASTEGTRIITALTGPLITIGRGSDATVVLTHDDVSRKHASVELTDAGILVRDLSTNGTFVEGKRVAGAQPLPFGKPVKIGPFTLRFRPPNSSGSGPVATRTAAGEVKKAAPPPVPLEALAASPSAPLHVEPSVVAEGARPSESVELPPPPPRRKVVGVQENAVTQIPDLSDAERDRLKRWLRGLLLESLDLPSLRPEELQDKALAPRVLQLMDELLDEHARELPKGLDRGRLRKELADEVLGLGPLEDLLSDVTVSEVMVVDRATIYVERRGRLELTGQRFSSEDALRSAIERIVTPLGRRIDESTPMVDARLKDGSRVNAIIPPLALRGPCLTIRKFSAKKLSVDDLIGFGSIDARMSRFLTRAVVARRNILVSGGTGSGKTTLLNILSSAIPDDERIVTIEDAAELRLDQPHVVSLETRPPNMEGKGEYSIRDLVKNALRMRPDRIVVGECRGGEALDMLQAMNTGHDGSLTTTHANSPNEAIARLETLVLMGGIDLPTRAIREQIANSIHVVVQQQRFVDGSRKITSIAEVVGMDDEGSVQLEPIFEFHRLASERGKVRGEFRATGYMPSFIAEFITMGLVTDGEYL
ncbi:MAG: Type secretion system hydrolase TadA/VirB11/CpaF, TadA subfamily [Myxococcales bacterium]|nr:Type secretion system hydrolase TadA/VirB11/CpaF, TadA subfamily [Myxococcales bacterium]